MTELARTRLVGRDGEGRLKLKWMNCGKELRERHPEDTPGGLWLVHAPFGSCTR